MRLELKNIGKISHAEIEFGGLTVLAGENDTGKSTVGKILFSLIKSISRQKEDLEESKEGKLSKEIERIYFILRRSVPIINEDIYKEFKDLFYPPFFFNELKRYLSIEEYFSSIDDLELILDKRKIFIEKYNNISNKEELKEHLNRITKIIKVKEDYIFTLKNAFSKVIKSEFYSQITSFNKDVSLINFSDNDIIDLEIELDKNNISIISLSNFISNNLFPIKDVLFIESPLYLQLFDILNQTQTLLYEEDNSRRFSNRIPLHIKDLTNKLSLNRYPHENRDIQIENITEIIKGKFVYEKNSSQFVFKPKDGSKTNSVKISNVASGIKSFGILQLLLNVNEINNNKMLILDEPENHLHPKWQIEFANILVKMVKQGVPIVVSSHSPYFIQALKHYSIKEDVFNITKFYIAEEDPNENSMTIIKDATNDLNSIFTKLAKPLNEIM